MLHLHFSITWFINNWILFAFNTCCFWFCTLSNDLLLHHHEMTGAVLSVSSVCVSVCDNNSTLLTFKVIINVVISVEIVFDHNHGDISFFTIHTLKLDVSSIFALFPLRFVHSFLHSDAVLTSFFLCLLIRYFVPWCLNNLLNNNTNIWIC